MSDTQISDNGCSMANLYIVLNDLSQNVSGCQLSDTQTSDLSSLIKGTSNVLEEIAIFLKKYETLGKESATMSSKIEKAWKKVRWDQDAIRDFRSRITLNTTALNTLNSSLTSRASRMAIENIVALDKRFENLQLDNDQTERQVLLNWLTPLNFPAQQSFFFGKRQEGTGQWLLHSADFKSWMSTPGKTLICRGMPGAGKTILASTVIGHLQTMLRGNGNPVAYIYCDYRKQYEQTPVHLIASILKQLLQHQISIPEIVWKSYRHHVKYGTHPTTEEICTPLQSTLYTLSQIYIVVDAVDELNVSDQVRQTLMLKLNAFQEAHTINLMMISRPIPQITQELREPLCLEIRASDEDVRKYVQGHIDGLAKCIRGNPQLQELIVDFIVNAVDGMFLLAQLHLDSLTDKTSLKAIKRSLQALPKGSDALDIAYEQSMQRIDAQKPGFRDLAKRAIGWITYACRLLYVPELCHALAIEFGASEFDEENLDDIEQILSVCCGLVTIDPETEAVRLVHYTTQEYFERAGSHHFPHAQEDIAASCLTYLLFDEFGKGWIGDCYNEDIHPRHDMRTPLYARLEDYPFIEYAICFWARHAEACAINSEGRLGRLLVDFHVDDCKSSSAGEMMFHLRNDYLYEYGYKSLSSTPMTGLHLVAILNLPNIMSILLESTLFTADVQDQYGRTPLTLAAQAGNEAVVELLVQRQDVDVNRTPKVSPFIIGPATALTWAAWKGQVGVVKLMLQREDIDVNKRAGNHHHWTPLNLAVAHRHSKVVKVLLEHKDGQDIEGSTPSSGSWVHEDPGIDQAVLERAETDANNKVGTPLEIATQHGNIDIMKLLLEHRKLDVNSSITWLLSTLSSMRKGDKGADVISDSSSLSSLNSSAV